MTGSQELRNVFCEAMERKTPQEQANYLDQACQGRPELRSRVEALLRANSEASGFLQEPAGRTEATVTQTRLEGPGTVIGSYKLLEQIGEGGFGLVFMAEQQQPVRRKVAVKVLKPGMDSRQVIARFEAERQALALMDHVNIARVLEAGETGSGRPYFAMELVRGVPITDYCDRNSLPPRARLELFASVCQAVQHAHQKGIIHRDIKPSNVLVTLHDGVPVAKVIDFGIAKALGQQLTDKTLYTCFAQLVGTPLYMSPEQAEMSGLDVDTRSDIYSLGVLLYELLTGTTPFDKDRLSKAAFDEIRRIIREEDPAKPSTRISTMGQAATPVSARRQSDPKRLSQLFRGELDWIVMKALEKDRNRRYETAGLLAADVQHYLHDEPVAACPPSSWYLFRKFARRRRAALTMAAVLTTALVVAAASVGWVARDQSAREVIVAERDLAVKNKERAEEAEQRALAAEKENKIRAHLARAGAARRSGEPGRRARTLAEIRAILALGPSASLRRDLRNEAIAALCLADLQMDREVGSETVGVSAVTIDAAFQRYAFADKDGKVSIRRLSDDRELLQLRGGGHVDAYGGLGFSPDGRFLHQSCHVQGKIQSRLWDLERLKPKAVLDDEHGGFGFGPDSRQCAASYPDGTIRILEMASGRELRRFRVDFDLTAGLWWNPKLPQLVIGTRRALRLLALDTGKVSSVGPKLAYYDWVDWHPEGRTLAVSGGKILLDDIYLWDVSAGRLLLPPLTGHKNGGVVMRFNHAGDRLLSTDWSDSGKLWDTRSGKLLLSLPISQAPPYFSPDDRLVGTGASGKVRLYRFQRGEELGTLAHYRATGWAFAAGPSDLGPLGRLCALWIPNEGIGMVDVARVEEAALLALPGTNLPVRFDSKGALWTSGAAGLLRWPVTGDAKTGQRRYGPPQRILQRAPAGQGAGSPDLRIVAMSQPHTNNGALVFHRDNKRLVPLGPQQDVRACAVSPDGRWIAAGTHGLTQGAGAKVWDAGDGRHIQDLPVGGPCGVWFSPGGKWLLTTGGAPRLWAVDTWEEGPKLGGTPSNPFGAFTCDDKLLALGDQPGVVRLLVADAGAEIARLTAPEQVRLAPNCFTPDGTKLVTVGYETGAVYIFDLAAIRAGLAELDLDWDAPALVAKSASVARGAMPPPLSISFDLGDMQHWAEADALVKEAARQSNGNEHAKALGTLRQAVKIAPTLALAHNNLAWLLLTGPKELRDPAQALPEARKAVAANPDEPLYQNTLGVALYRVGQFAEAVNALEKSLRRGMGKTDAFDLFFLAMCHHRLGDAAKAKDRRQRGACWFECHQSELTPEWQAELTAFQAEADMVLAAAPGKAKK
jgi:serine/threonine protein kinase/WD40 repeat protein/Tfp pilus assembly protein PilF